MQKVAIGKVNRYLLPSKLLQNAYPSAKSGISNVRKQLKTLENSDIFFDPYLIENESPERALFSAWKAVQSDSDINRVRSARTEMSPTYICLEGSTFIRG